jgi:hypothetical protein
MVSHTLRQFLQNTLAGLDTVLGQMETSKTEFKVHGE